MQVEDLIGVLAESTERVRQDSKEVVRAWKTLDAHLQNTYRDLCFVRQVWGVGSGL